MNHLDATTIDSYLDGALAPAELAAAEVHLAHCAACRAALAQQRGVFVALHSLPDEAIPLDLTAAVLAEVAPAAAPAQAGWYARAVLAAQAAAIGLLLVRLWPTLAAWAGVYLAALPTLAGGAAAWERLPQLSWPAPPPGWLAGVDSALPAVLAGIGPLQAGLTLAIALLIWLAGNRLLLGAHPSQEAA